MLGRLFDKEALRSSISTKLARAAARTGCQEPGLGLRSEDAPSRRGATARLAPRARGFNSPQGELAVCEHSSGSCIIVQGVSDGGPSDARDGVRTQR